MDRLVFEFLHASSEVFLQAREEGGLDSFGGDKPEVMSKYSTSLRKLLTEFVGRIQTSFNGVEYWRVEDLFVDEIEKVWHLCQIFLLTSPNLVSIELAKWLKTSTGQLFFGDMDAALQQMDSMDQPELYAGEPSKDGEEGLGYWDAVLRLAMQGDLQEVWQLLAMHSEIPADSSTARSRAVQSTARRLASDRTAAQELERLLLSHPYASLLRKEVSEDEGEEEDGIDMQHLSAGLSAELQKWKYQLGQWALSREGSALQGKVPELAALVGLLGGDEDTISGVSLFRWKDLVLAQLLYVYSPPLTRANLGKILVAALNGDPSLREGSGESAQETTLRKLIANEPGAAISHLYASGDETLRQLLVVIEKAGGAGMAQLGRVSLVAQACNVYVAYLLARGAGVELFVPYQQHSGGSSGGGGRDWNSWYERQVTELCQGLLGGWYDNDMNDKNNMKDKEVYSEVRYPLSLLDKFIRVMAPDARAADQTLAVYRTARTLLPKACAETDEEAVQLSDALRSHVIAVSASQHPDARELQRELAAEAREVDAKRAKFWLTRPKADLLYYEEQALKEKENEDREEEGDLDADEDDKKLPRARAMYFLLRAEDERQVASLLEDCLVRCVAAVSDCPLLFPGLQPVPAIKTAPRHLSLTPTDLNTATTSNNPNDAAAKLRRVYVALNETEQVLDATRQFAVAEGGRLINPEHGPLWATLDVYHTALRTYEQTFQHAHTLLGSPTDLAAFVQPQHAPQVREVQTMLRTGAKALSLLVGENVAPARHWAHILQLLVWLKQKHQSLNRALPLAMRPPVPVDSSVEESATSIFDRESVYKLLECCERLQGSHDADRVSVPVCQEDSGSLREMRVALLSLLADASMEENEARGSGSGVSSISSQSTFIGTGAGNSGEAQHAQGFFVGRYGAKEKEMAKMKEMSTQRLPVRAIDMLAGESFF